MKLSAPNVRDLEALEGAAISSTSRLLLPVDEITVFEGTSDVGKRRVFVEQPLMRRLEALVLEDIKANSEPVLLKSRLSVN